MTKWNLPEGRKPLTAADMAALSRRLADTAIEQSELYQAAKRDAEEAEAYAAALEAELLETQDRANAFATKEYYTEMRAERAEDKLAKAVEALRRISLAEQNSGTRLSDIGREARATLAELK